MKQRALDRLLRSPRMKDSVVLLDGQSRKERYDITLEQIRDYVLQDVLRIAKEEGEEYVSFSQLVKSIRNARVMQLRDAAVGQLAEPLEPSNNPISTLVLKETDVVRFRKGDPVKVVNPLTFNEKIFTARANQVDRNVLVEETNINSRFPIGSFVFLNPAGVNLGIIAGLSAIQLFAESNAVGVVTEAVDDRTDEIPVHLWGFLSAGDVINFLPEVSPTNVTGQPLNPVPAVVRSVDGAERYDSGMMMLPVNEQYYRLPEGTYFILNGVSLSSRFHVDPGKIQGVVERTQRDTNMGTFNQDRIAGANYNSVNLKDIDGAVPVEEGQVLRIFNREGQSEVVTVSVTKTLTTANNVLQFETKTFTHSYFAGHAWVGEPGYKLSGRLTIEAGKVEANASAIQKVGDDLIIESNARLLLRADLESAEATLSADIKKVEDDLVIESDARLALRSDFESAEATLSADISRVEGDLVIESNARLALESRVTSAEGAIDSQASALLSANSSINNLVLDSAYTFRQSSQPLVRPSGQSLRAGDVWIDTGNNNITKYWTGSVWATSDATASLNLSSRVTSSEGKLDRIEAKAALVVDAGGTIGRINLTADGLTGISTVKIKGTNIELDGDTTVTGDFKIKGTNIELDGDTTVTGDFAVADAVGISAQGTWRIWAGQSGANRSTAPFRVRNDGVVFAKGTNNEFSGDFSGHFDGEISADSFKAKISGGTTEVRMDSLGFSGYNASNNYKFAEQLYFHASGIANGGWRAIKTVSLPWHTISFHIHWSARRPNGGGAVMSTRALIVRTNSTGNILGFGAHELAGSRIDNGWSGAYPTFGVVNFGSGIQLRVTNTSGDSIGISCYIQLLNVQT